MKAYLLALVVLLTASSVVAETFPIPIHGHSQRTAYTSRDEMLWLKPQSHWTPGNPVIPIPAGAAVMTSHAVHIEMRCPYLGVFNQRFRCDYVIKAFHFDGRVVSFDAGILQGRSGVIVWDTPTGAQPAMTGDPHGLVQWSGRFDTDPDPTFPHGWVYLTGSANVQFTNGDTIRANSHVAVWSELDLNKPIEYGFPFVSMRATPATQRRPDIVFGANQMDILDPLPLAAISQPWTMRLSPILYTLNNQNLPPARVDMIADLDLHNNVPGRKLLSVVNPPNPMTVTLDPKQLGPGPHTVALFLTQPDGGLEEVSSIVAFTVTVGDDVPPPPPPPTPVWTTIDTTVVGPTTITVQQLGSEQTFRMCVNNVCGAQQP